MKPTIHLFVASLVISTMSSANGAFSIVSKTKGFPDSNKAQAGLPCGAAAECHPWRAVASPALFDPLPGSIRRFPYWNLVR